MYAIVTDVTPERATVLYTGTASEVLSVLDGENIDYTAPEDRKIVAVQQAQRGDRVWHGGAWIQPDSLR